MSYPTPEYTKSYREIHREKIKEYQDVYMKRDDVKARRTAYRRAHPEMQMLHSAKHRAAKRGTLFDIKKSDIIIPDICPILGIPIFVSNGRPGNNSPTLDEVRQGEGYTKGNVRVISHKANTMKQDHTVESMERFILYMKGTL